eukprot:TRINITY_DN2018_c0_g1_i1.p1 TRINITY_DN2018_c0_g1~~TRINITY_DN2018_c0_g1_i1.p1  ORF type:complete len:276 (+),score=68.89 TRINITY_DN2018_c0_g1_i1:242-1069(+)
MTRVLSFFNPPGCFFYEQIKLGKKIVEGRKYSELIAMFRVGDLLFLCDKSNSRGLRCKISRISLYDDLISYLTSETIESAFGDVSAYNVKLESLEDACRIYHNFVSDESIADAKLQFGHGFAGIGVEYVSEHRFISGESIMLSDPWFEHVSNGDKKIEVRLNRLWVKDIQVDDVIQFDRKRAHVDQEEEDEMKLTRHNQESLVVIIKARQDFATFEALFDSLVDLSAILPGIAADHRSAVEVYRQWYSEQDEVKHGVVALRIELLAKVHQRRAGL